MPRQDLCERAFTFAGAAFRFANRLTPLGPLYSHIALQLFKAASSIGANLEEGHAASSRRDMAAKYAISLRESREARFWLRLVAADAQFNAEALPLIREATEFVNMLTPSVRRLRDSPDDGPDSQDSPLT